MIKYPNIDPIALKLGPLKIHWYGIMYLFGFWGAWFLAVRRGKRDYVNFSNEQVSDLLFYGVLGVILGGRIGYTLFYNLHQFLADPTVIFRIWEGGMSFHGGLLGVICAMAIYGRIHKRPFFEIADFVAVVVPLGLGLGRVGNFINSELWGSPTNLPWAMIFPNDPAHLPRHPSMLYEAILEGPVLLAILWFFGNKPRPRMAMSGLFLLGYGCFRILVEQVRLPDAPIGYLYGGWLTEGMLLSFPMVLIGLGMMIFAYRRARPA